jgi:hypothetical protein
VVSLRTVAFRRMFSRVCLQFSVGSYFVFTGYVICSNRDPAVLIRITVSIVNCIHESSRIFRYFIVSHVRKSCEEVKLLDSEYLDIVLFYLCFRVSRTTG